MVRRIAAVACLALAVGACASADLSRDEVAGVVEGAFASADQAVSDIEVAVEQVDGRWPVNANISGQPIDLEVDSADGRIVSVDFGVEAVAMTQAQLEDVAGYADNPSADSARRGQLVTIFAALAIFIAGGLAVARRLRLREEAQLEAGSTLDLS